MPSAFILINCDFKSANEVINQLKEIPEVVQVYPVDGVYDILSKINATNEDDLRKVVLRIRYLDSVSISRSYHEKKKLPIRHSA
jgi:DNA-binding Lrp family transcriptional regulator